MDCNTYDSKPKVLLLVMYIPAKALVTGFVRQLITYG